MIPQYTDTNLHNTASYKGPVTLSGWYERTDGKVTYFFCMAGRLCEGRTVDNWAATAACVFPSA